ncbi:hypothetical protein ACFLW3_01015 [Chloroflexota bacterium]
MREVDIASLNYLKLFDIAERFSGESKYINLGDYGTYLDFKPYIMKKTFASIASEFFSWHTSDEDRVREVWNMVTQLDTYYAETKEPPRLPLETLLLGGGNCEDMTIQTASTLKAMGPNWKVELVYMDSNNPTEINKPNHFTVHVDAGEYQTFVESPTKKQCAHGQK